MGNRTGAYHLIRAILGRLLFQLSHPVSLQMISLSFTLLLLSHAHTHACTYAITDRHKQKPTHAGSHTHHHSLLHYFIAFESAQTDWTEYSGTPSGDS